MEAERRLSEPADPKALACQWIVLSRQIIVYYGHTLGLTPHTARMEILGSDDYGVP